MAYGIVHNNKFYLWHPIKKDGTKQKKLWHQKIWTTWSGPNDGTCQPYDTEEEARANAEELFWDPKSYRIVELDENNYPIVTKELEDLGYGALLPDEK